MNELRDFQAVISAIMNKVYDWQIANPVEINEKNNNLWPRTAFHTGIMAAYCLVLHHPVGVRGDVVHVVERADCCARDLDQHVRAASSGCGIWWSICSFFGSPNS